MNSASDAPLAEGRDFGLSAEPLPGDRVRFGATVSIISLVSAFFAVILSGLSLAPTGLLLVFCGALTALYVLREAKLSSAAFLVLSFLGYCLFSGIFFSGIDSVFSVGVVHWLSNEGRIFLAYWPAILILVYGRFVGAESDRIVIRALKYTTVVYVLGATVARFSGVLGDYSHHAGGAVGASLFIIWFLLYQSDKEKMYLIMLAAASVGLVASDSRTGILGSALVLILMGMSLKNIKQLALGVIIFISMLFVMNAFYPKVYDRLSGAITASTMQAMGQQLGRVFQDRSFEETSDAWGVASYVPDQGEVNLVIRAYLWARGLSEGGGSPIHGIGFGRFNDIGRTFEGVRGVSYAVYKADRASGSVFTAHNTFVHIFAELGLIGVAFVAAIFVTLHRAYSSCSEKAGLKWARIGKAMCLSLAVMGMFQHSLGAPIFLFTMFTMAAWCYCRVRMYS